MSITPAYVMDDIKSLISITRERLTLKSVETYFFLMAAFATLGMFFKIFADIGPQYGDLELHEIFAVLGSMFLAITLGTLIFLTAMLSIYFDDRYRMERDIIWSSNFYFTRLVTPVARGLILLISLILFLYSLTVF